jgi:hypothetical protein
MDAASGWPLPFMVNVLEGPNAMNQPALLLLIHGISSLRPTGEDVTIAALDADEVRPRRTVMRLLTPLVSRAASGRRSRPVCVNLSRKY